MNLAWGRLGRVGFEFVTHHPLLDRSFSYQTFPNQRPRLILCQVSSWGTGGDEHVVILV
jgi:hypothetical protein